MDDADREILTAFADGDQVEAALCRAVLAEAGRVDEAIELVADLFQQHRPYCTFPATTIAGLRGLGSEAPTGAPFAVDAAVAAAPTEAPAATCETDTTCGRPAVTASRNARGERVVPWCGVCLPSGVKRQGLGGPQFLALHAWAREVEEFFGSAHATPYLVGSCAYGDAKTARDVDVVVILPDDEYAAWFGDDPSGPISVNARRRALCAAFSMWGTARLAMPVDFKVQQMTRANAEHDGPRHPLGIVVQTPDSPPPSAGSPGTPEEPAERRGPVIRQPHLDELLEVWADHRDEAGLDQLIALLVALRDRGYLVSADTPEGEAP